MAKSKTRGSKPKKTPATKVTDFPETSPRKESPETQTPEEPIEDAISGEDTQPVTQQSVPGEDDTPVEVDPSVERTQRTYVIASSIFDTVRKVFPNRELMKKLSHFQRVTLQGAYLLTGHMLNKKDNRGDIRLIRACTYLSDSLFPDLFKTRVPARPVCAVNAEDTEVSHDWAEQSIPDEVAELIGLPDDLTQELTERDIPDGVTWIAYVYEQIKGVRSTRRWLTHTDDYGRKALQGIQITAAQLLGLRDKSGPITLERYMRSGLTNPRIFNALGYAATPLKSRKKESNFESDNNILSK